MDCLPDTPPWRCRMNLAGWDTLSAVAVDEVNRGLEQRRRELVRRLSFTLNIDTIHEKFYGEIALGMWQIVPGGSGALLHIRIGVASGKLCRSVPTEYVDLAGSDMIFSVSLNRLPSRTVANGHDFVFALDRAGFLGATPDEGVITPIAFTGPESVLGRLGSAGQAIVIDAAAKELSRKSEVLSFVLATVGFTTPGAEGWLAPKSSGYTSFFEAGTEYLGIMAVTTDRPAETLQRTVDGGVVRGGAMAGFAMSRELFSRHVLMPIIASALGGEAKDAIAYSADRGIVTASRPFLTMSVRAGLIDYWPRVLTLDAHIAGDGVDMAVTGDCDLKAGIVMTWSVNAHCAMAFDVTRQVLFFQPDPHPTITHSAAIPWWFFLIAMLPAAIAKLVGKILAENISASLSNHLAASALVQASATSVQWAGLRRMTVTEASLDGALILRGRL